ncbi:TPA: methylated-DNA--[protein]-cysteine S-methyltransferase, partial [Legionella pneumophila]
PCHRVVGKHDLGGYMGNPNAISYKKNLLAHEAKII